MQVLFEAFPPSIERIKAGNLLPTVGEFIPGYEASGWNGTFAPNMPADIIARLNVVISAGLPERRIKTRLSGLGATILPGSPTDFEKPIAVETDKCDKVIRTADIMAE